MNKYSYNLKEAIEYSGLSEWQLRRAIYRKDLKVTKPIKPNGVAKNNRGRILIKREDLESFVDNGEIK